MNIKKSLLIASAITTLGAVGTVGIASAATNSSANPQDSLVQKIAEKFHLNKTDVQAVFDQEHADREAAQQKKVEDELTQLVTDGKLTAVQKQAILDKRASLQAERQANKDDMQNKPKDERKAAMDAKKTELEKWASDNGIAKEYLRFVAGHGGRGHGGPGMRADAPADN